ncbi:hypothetical protein ACOSQ3_014373 [Xanthoceras sorbifolium]
MLLPLLALSFLPPKSGLHWCFSSFKAAVTFAIFSLIPATSYNCCVQSPAAPLWCLFLVIPQPPAAVFIALSSSQPAPISFPQLLPPLPWCC